MLSSKALELLEYLKGTGKKDFASPDVVPKFPNSDDLLDELQDAGYVEIEKQYYVQPFTLTEKAEKS